MLRTEQCGFCRGTGTAQSLEERTANGEWVPNKALDHAMADVWIAADPHAPIRWRDCACPICGGDGSYELEFPRCKIF